MNWHNTLSEPPPPLRSFAVVLWISCWAPFNKYVTTHTFKMEERPQENIVGEKNPSNVSGKSAILKPIVL